MRTFVYAFTSGTQRVATAHSLVDYAAATSPQGHALAHSSLAPPGTEHAEGRRRALVLRGHDGAGALAVQLLAARGWRVSVHVPVAAVPALSPALDAHNAEQAAGAHPQFVPNGHAAPNHNYSAASAASAMGSTPDMDDDSPLHRAEMRARLWGADEVVYDDGGTDTELEADGIDGGQGAAVRVLATLRADGDVFDAVLDAVGGKAVWAAAEALLASPGGPPPGVDAPGPGGESFDIPRRRGVGQFTTLAGHNPARVVPTARDNFRAGLRALRMGSSSTPSASSTQDGAPSTRSSGRVGYAWVSVAQDVDWEGQDVAETLGAVVRLALAGALRPPLDGLDADEGAGSRVWPLERAPEAFMDGGPLMDGGTVVIRVA